MSNALSGEQVAQLLYQAGFRGEALNEMVGIGKRESGYRPDAHRTDADPNGNTGDFGLFQINYVNVPGLVRAGIITTARDLLDPVMNAKAAYYLSHQGTSFAAWASGSGGWEANGSPLHGVDISTARTVVANAASQGLLGKDYQTGGVVPNQTTYNNDGTVASTTGGSSAQGANSTSSTESPTATPQGTPITAPSDAQYIRDATGREFVMFDVGGAKVAYSIGAGEISTAGRNVTQINADQWKTLGIFDGGDINEIGQVASQFGSYHAFFDSVLAKVMGPNNPAANDPSVRAVLVQKASRWDMSDQEFSNLLSGTTWYQQHTQGQLNWNGLGDAEKQKQRDDASVAMVNAWVQDHGGTVSATDPRIASYIERVASGQMSLGNWVQNVEQPNAAQQDGSPFSQNLKTPGINVENTAGNIRQQLTKWGIQWSEGTIQQWARDVVNKDKSDDDLTETLKGQAQILYPWKDRDTDTTSAATPWTETYKRVMEKEGVLTNPDIQKALTNGTQPWQFEQDLKHSTGWLNTKNAQTDLSTMIGNVGKTMGFA